MRAYGSDRFRIAGERVILHSRLPKGWTPRRAAEGTHAEFPGTTVFWDECYYEVIAADALPQGGGVRYELELWNDAHTIRVFEHYNDESEARLLADHRNAQKQRASNIAARLTGIILGNLPYDAQLRIANNLGVSPFAMTMLSLIPNVLVLAACAWAYVDSIIASKPSPIPDWLWLVAAFLFAESFVRMFVAMSQNRGMGSVLGGIVWVILHPREVIKGSHDAFNPKVFQPTEYTELHDAMLMRGPLLTLLSVDEQRWLADTYGYDHREHAYVITWTILLGSLFGAMYELSVLVYSPFRLSALLSMLVAAYLAGEQILRLVAIPHRPAASVLAFVARPFARKLLERS